MPLFIAICLILFLNITSVSANDWRGYDFGADEKSTKPFLADEWLFMSADEALNYYTPLEVCHLYDLEDLGDGIKCSLFENGHEHMEVDCMVQTQAPRIGQHRQYFCGKNHGAKFRYVHSTP